MEKYFSLIKLLLVIKVVKMSQYKNLPKLIPLGEEFSSNQNQPSNDVDKKNANGNSQIGCVVTHKKACSIGRGGKTHGSYSRGGAIQRMFPAAMHQLKSCDTGKTKNVQRVRTIHVYREPCPKKAPGKMYRRGPPPRPKICPKPFRPSRACVKPVAKDCCPKVTKVICVDKSLPKNKAPVKVKKVYKAKPDCDPCVDQILRKQQDFLNPVEGMQHIPKIKPYDHCHMELGPAFTVYGRGSICSEDQILDIKGSTDFFINDLGETAERTLARENEAKEFFDKMFGVDFRDCTPTDGIYRTKEAKMYPFRIPREIKTVVRLCSGGTAAQEQVRIYQGGFAVEMTANFQAGGEYARMNDECVVLKKGTILLFGLKKMQKFVETQEEVTVEDPCDPCKTSKRWKTTWVAQDEPAFVSFATEKPCEPNMVQRCIFMRSKIESSKMRGYSTTAISWEPVCEGCVNFILEECWNFEAETQKQKSDDGW